MRRKKITPSRVFVFLLLAATAVVTLAPFVYMVITTFKEKSEYLVNMFGMPENFSFKNYKIIFENYDVLRMNLNSFKVVIISVLGTLLITSMAGYALAKLDFKGKKLLYALIAFCMIMPGQVLMIPVYHILTKLHLINSLVGLVLIYMTSSIPFATFLFAANCLGIPDGVIEAAKIEGAGFVRIYTAIVLPLLRPTLAAVAILNFISYWNELFWAMILVQKESERTLTVGLVSLTGRFGSNTPLVYTGLFINCIPIIVIFFIFQKQLIKGTSAGALK
ncbi:MAG: carbohydrate ABC transporter permease [Bacillota bacterium]|nr:carbohydrate ABC transporter permease [Bacillota bacterium]